VLHVIRFEQSSADSSVVYYAHHILYVYYYVCGCRTARLQTGRWTYYYYFEDFEKSRPPPTPCPTPSSDSLRLQPDSRSETSSAYVAAPHVIVYRVSQYSSTSLFFFLQVHVTISNNIVITAARAAKPGHRSFDNFWFTLEMIKKTCII